MITPNTYTRYLRKSIPIKTFGAALWVSMSAFYIMSKATLGTDNIPMFETVFQVAGLAGTWLAYRKVHSVRTMLIITIITEAIVSIILMTSVFGDDPLADSAAPIYLFLIMNALITMPLMEAKRTFEDHHMQSLRAKGILKVLRKQIRYAQITAMIVGSAVGMILLSYFKVDIILFAQVGTSLFLAEHSIAIYLVMKYLKPLK